MIYFTCFFSYTCRNHLSFLTFSSSLISIICRRNDAYDDKAPEEVLGERVKRVGGQDAYDPELDPNTYL